MKHKTTGLARRCSPGDLILVTGGLQCGNCLAYEETYHERLIAIKLSWRYTTPEKTDVHLVFIHTYGGEVWVTRPGQETNKVIQSVWWGTGQLVYPLSGGPTDPNDRQLSVAEWDAFRQAHDVREAYSINHTWQAIRSF